MHNYVVISVSSNRNETKVICDINEWKAFESGTTLERLFCVTKCSVPLPMIINMSHFVFQQGVFCLCSFRVLGKSIKMFLVLILGHMHKVGLVNGYPLQYGHLKCKSVRVMSLNQQNRLCTPYVCWLSSHPSQSRTHTHMHTTEQRAYLMDMWRTLLVGRCDDAFLCFLSCLDELNRSSLLDFRRFKVQRSQTAC